MTEFVAFESVVFVHGERDQWDTRKLFTSGSIQVLQKLQARTASTWSFFSASFWNLDRTTRRALFEAFRTSYFFQFCRYSVTQKMATGVGHLNRFWCPGEGNLTAENAQGSAGGGGGGVDVSNWSAHNSHSLEFVRLGNLSRTQPALGIFGMVFIFSTLLTCR